MELDYAITSIDDRIILVAQIIKENQDLIERHFGLMKNHPLLSKLTNYILYCGKDVGYKEKMQDKFEKSAFLLQDENYIFDNKVVITKKDFENADIKDKENFIKYIYNKYGHKTSIRNWIRDLKYDQTVIKQSQSKVVRPETISKVPSFSENYEIDNYWKDIFEINSIHHLLNLDLFDEESWKIVLKLLSFYHKISGNVDRLVKLFNKCYHLCEFTQLQRSIIHTYQMGSEDIFNDFKILKNKDVANKLNIKQNTFSDNLESINKKLCTAYEILFTEYYYTFLVKGTYRTCKKCGQVKIIQDFYDNRAICTECFNKK